MPAVTPADVASRPSRTKIGSGSTRTAGYVRGSVSQTDQWVVTRCPSSWPAAASSRAPVHTDTSCRAPRGPWARSQSTSSGSGVLVPAPPGTRSRSGAGVSASVPSGTSVRPLEQRTGAPSSEAVRSS